MNPGCALSVTLQPVAQPADYPWAAHALWTQLLARQRRAVRQWACPEFWEGLEGLHLPADRIPRLEQLSAQLHSLAEWTVVPVAGLLPEADFFGFLAQRQFPVTWWLRAPEQADYLVEPDLFHDVFGHLPMLTLPSVGDFIQAYAQTVLRVSDDPKAVQALTRLYWFTIEFGLVQGPREKPQIYGGGILSSAHESQWAVEAREVERVPAEPLAMMRQAYAIDVPQARYFVLDRLHTLWSWTPERLEAWAREAAGLPDAPIARAKMV